MGKVKLNVFTRNWKVVQLNKKIFISSEINHSSGTKKAGKFTIAELYQILETKQKEIKEAIEYIEELESENNRITNLYNNINESLERGKNVLLTEEDTIKKVLELRAKNYAPSLISEKLNYIGIEVSTKKVKDIVNSELSTELELFYNKCKSEYAEAIKINSSVLKQTNIEEIQRLIDSCYDDLEFLEKDDVKLRSALRIEAKGLINERNNLIKNIDDFESVDEQDEDVTEMTSSFKEESTNIINFNKINGVKIKKVGG